MRTSVDSGAEHAGFGEIMTYAIAFGAAFLVYYLRKYWLSPWGVYVSHSRTKAGDVFLTVKHTH